MRGPDLMGRKGKKAAPATAPAPPPLAESLSRLEAGRKTPPSYEMKL